MEEVDKVTKEELEVLLKDLEKEEPKEEPSEEEAVEEEVEFEGVDDVKDIPKGQENRYGI